MATYQVEVTRSCTVEVNAPNEILATVAGRDAAADIPLEQWVHVDAEARSLWKTRRDA